MSAFVTETRWHLLHWEEIPNIYCRQLLQILSLCVPYIESAVKAKSRRVTLFDKFANSRDRDQFEDRGVGP